MILCNGPGQFLSDLSCESELNVLPSQVAASLSTSGQRHVRNKKGKNHTCLYYIHMYIKIPTKSAFGKSLDKFKLDQIRPSLLPRSYRSYTSTKKSTSASNRQFVVIARWSLMIPCQIQAKYLWVEIGFVAYTMYKYFPFPWGLVS